MPVIGFLSIASQRLDDPLRLAFFWEGLKEAGYVEGRNVVTDFIPVTMVVATQYVIGGSLKHPATTLRELAVDAKAAWPRPATGHQKSSSPKYHARTDGI
jgi:hypothetical protein